MYNRSLACLTRIVTVGMVALLVEGCKSATTSQAEIKYFETRELALSYDEAYTAAANGLFSLGYAIDHSDKESGILSATRHDPRTSKKIANTLLFGVVGLAATPGPARIERLYGHIGKDASGGGSQFSPRKKLWESNSTGCQCQNSPRNAALEDRNPLWRNGFNVRWPWQPHRVRIKQ